MLDLSGWPRTVSSLCHYHYSFSYSLPDETFRRKESDSLAWGVNHGLLSRADYAPAVLKLAAVMPDITLPTSSHHRFGASAMRMKSRPNPAHEIRITGRRPK